MTFIAIYMLLPMVFKVSTSLDPMGDCTTIPTHHFATFLDAPAVQQLKGVMKQTALIDADDNIFKQQAACVCDVVSNLDHLALTRGLPLLGIRSTP